MMDAEYLHKRNLSIVNMKLHIDHSEQSTSTKKICRLNF